MQDSSSSSSGSSSSLPPPTDCDLVGPPDRVSNLRPRRFYAPPGESPLRRRLRRLRQDTQDWSHAFWREHNTKFAEVGQE